MEHKNVIALVRRFQNDFKEFGTFAFETRKSGGRDTQYAELNEDQATYLMTLFRNTEVVRVFKIRLVKEFRRALNELARLSQQRSDPAWQLVRDETKVGYKWMSEALQEQRATSGKKTLPHHYANEARMINAVLTGRYEALDRDSMSQSDLELFTYLQRRNAALILQNVPYRVRKDLLTAIVLQKLEHQNA